MSATSSKKLQQDLLLPGPTSWERWTGPVGGSLKLEQTFETGGIGGFSKGVKKRFLALPGSSLWVLPLWLSGEAAHFETMVQLHLERAGVRCVAGAGGLIVNELAEENDRHLVRAIALKDQPSPLENLDFPPERCVPATSCFEFAPNALTIWRELGRLMMAITREDRLLYWSSLTSLTLNAEAISEIKQISFQLVFQEALPEIDNVILWSDGECAEAITLSTGLPVVVQERPAPQVTEKAVANLKPPDIAETEKKIAAQKRHRVQLLLGGFVLAAIIAALMVLTSLATKERTALRDELASLAPQAANIEQQRQSWEEVAPAMEPTRFPSELLLRLMDQPSSADIAFAHFEWTPQKVMIKAHALSINAALQYAQEVRQSPHLTDFKWEVPSPTIAEDNSAMFEVRGKGAE